MCLLLNYSVYTKSCVQGAAVQSCTFVYVPWSFYWGAVIFCILSNLSNHEQYLGLFLIPIHQNAFCMNWTSCSLCGWIMDQQHTGFDMLQQLKKSLNVKRGNMGLKTWPWFDTRPAALWWPDRNRSVCSYFWNLLLVRNLIRKAVSLLVSAGNELVSSEVSEFVGFVVFRYYSIQHLDSSSLCSEACFAPGTHF